MGAIQGVAFLQADGRPVRERARALARLAARLGIPADVVEFHGPLDEMEAAAGRGATGRALGRAVTEPARADAPCREAAEAALTDAFRWRAWVAHAMGAALVICPDAPPARDEALAAMGLSIVGPGDAAPDLTPLAGPGPEPAGGGGLDADLQVRLRALRVRAGEVVIGGFRAGTHEVGAVVVDRSGTVWSGLGVSGRDGVHPVCAEAVALSNAVMGGAQNLEYVAAVRHARAAPGDDGYRLVPPCPSCQALLADAGPDVRAIVDDASGLAALALSEHPT